MFETLTLTTILLTLFFFYQNQRLGLTGTIPKDLNDRVKFFCSECLTSVKNLLSGARIELLEPQRIHFFKAGEQTLSKLTLDQGKVLLESGGQPARALHNLGAQGKLEFEKVSEKGLMVTIEAHLEEASHRVAVRLEVQFPQPVAAG